MPQPLLQMFERFTIVDEQGRASVAKVVEANDGQAVVNQKLFEVMRNIDWLDEVPVFPHANAVRVGVHIRIPKPLLICLLLCFEIQKVLFCGREQRRDAV